MLCIPQNLQCFLWQVSVFWGVTKSAQSTADTGLHSSQHEPQCEFQPCRAASLAGSFIYSLKHKHLLLHLFCDEQTPCQSYASIADTERFCCKKIAPLVLPEHECLKTCTKTIEEKSTAKYIKATVLPFTSSLLPASVQNTPKRQQSLSSVCPN